MASYMLLLVAIVWHCCSVLVVDAKEGTTREMFLGGGLWVVNEGCLSVGKDPKSTYRGSRRCILEPKDTSPNIRKEGMKDVHSFRIPSLIEVDGVIIGIADCRYTSSEDFAFIDTVARYSADGGRTWKTEIIFENARVNKDHSRVVDPTVVVKNNTVFVLVGRYNNSKTWWPLMNDGDDWDILMYKGTVQKTVDESGNASATIVWKDPQYLKSLLGTVGKINGRSLIQYLGGVGNGIVTPNGTVVFPVQILNTENYLAAMILYSDDDGKTWEFSKGATPIGTTESSIVWWGERLLLNGRTDRPQSNVDAGYRKVFESSDMGATWVESLGTISRVIGNSPERNQPGSSGSSIKVTFDDVPVMLVTQPKNIHGKWIRDRLQLWLTDGNRVFFVGQISVGDDSSPYSSLLYTKTGELHCLYEQIVDSGVNIYLTHLVDELELIRSTVRLWKAQDRLLAGTCSSDVTDETTCTGIPTAGLVGLLAGPAVGTVWSDAYQCVNASVGGAAVIDDGLQLSGKNDSSVSWPVSEQGQDQRYHFANTHFTLVVTVQLAEITQNETSLVGFVTHDGQTSKYITLSLVKDVCRHGAGQVSGAVEDEQSPGTNGIHQVALTLSAGKVFAHLDGKHLPDMDTIVTGAGKLLNISRFFVGHPGVQDVAAGDGVVVKNVLLYNRQLSGSELRSLYLNNNVIAVSQLSPEGRSPSLLKDIAEGIGNEMNENCASLKLVVISDGGVRVHRLLYLLMGLGLLQLLSA
ncbi:trans-sialidase, putative [Trypanosoma brucei brucei TREU927]|uniref:Trans-sialidase, putative n=1 Tax=Trypanosoma brucei brucei (strain 927/4 GUTat10.1) TaxID=185431 RepID=Q57YT7_TRYB2|nr:trans-sialidase, putative [Trypanosoma brucei brucei TREU927]AAX69221.1 trans-sialidase, putative [Trypanosoma brucei]AAZ13498.1 trans-sialidase, putative [Trypanosoma brucei brucei TREU927]